MLKAEFPVWKWLTDVKLVPLGRVGKPHGVRGELRIWPHNPASSMLKRDRMIRLGREPERIQECRVVALRTDGKGPVIRLDGIDDRDKAAALTGCIWFGDRDEFGPISDDEVYIVDLVGLNVRTVDGRTVGVLKDVWQVGPADLLVIQDGRQQHLVPNIPDFVERIDVEGKEIIIRPIEGLIEGL